MAWSAPIASLAVVGSAGDEGEYDGELVGEYEGEEVGEYDGEPDPDPATYKVAE